MTLIYVLLENYFRQMSVETEYLLFLDHKLTMHVYSTALMVMEHKKIKTVLKWKNDRKKFKICSLSSKVTVGVAKKPWTIWNGKLLFHDWFFPFHLRMVCSCWQSYTKKLKFLLVNRGFSVGTKQDLPVPENFGNKQTVY